MAMMGLNFISDQSEKMEEYNEAKSVHRIKEQMYERLNNRPKYPTKDTMEQFKKECDDYKKELNDKLLEAKMTLNACGVIGKIFKF